MSQSKSSLWHPSADLQILRQRAILLQQIRDFFRQRSVLEVETPILSRAGSSDPFIDSFSTAFEGHNYYLHTSPELAMKRLLASGSGAIFQVAKVFRQGESGPKHNPEFSLLEWYRPGFELMQLMHEMAELLRLLLEPLAVQAVRYYSYQECFEKYLSINPHTANIQALQSVAQTVNLHQVLGTEDSQEQWLDLLMSHVIEANLGGTRTHPEICFVYDYPASQAALAQVQKNQHGQLVAKRFEVYIAAMELANGFYELQDPDEQRIRFQQENLQRQQLGKQTIPVDELFLQALQSGLPECSGVALGLDRVLMLLAAKEHLDEVLSFPLVRV